MNVSLALDKTDEWHQNRLTGLGGSDATIIMSGDNEKITRLWKEKRGEIEREDLSDILPVQMGSFTEPFNLFWFEKQTGKTPLLDMLECRHPNGFMRCELDGRIVGENSSIQAKHVNAFAKPEEVVEKYFWQVQHEMACSGADKSYLSVFFGTLKYEFFEIEADPEAQEKLEKVEQYFWDCVQDGTEPINEQHAVEIAFDDMREVDVKETNFASEFEDFATGWLKNGAAKKAYDKADKGLKEFIAEDVKRLFGFGVEVNRAKNGARKVKEVKDANKRNTR